MGASWAVLEAFWGHLSRLGGHLGRLGSVLETILGHLGAIWGRKTHSNQVWAIPARRAEAHWGALLEKSQTKPRGFSTPGPPAKIDRGRLRRITAAPCPFGSAYVADSWARAWPRCRTMRSPSRFGKRSGNTWGRMNMKRKRKRKRKSRRRRLLGSLLGHSWGLLGASWGPLGGLFGASLGLLGAFGGLLGASLAVLGRS